jgi:hypothetical protein
LTNNKYPFIISWKDLAIIKETYNFKEMKKLFDEKNKDTQIGEYNDSNIPAPYKKTWRGVKNFEYSEIYSALKDVASKVDIVGDIVTIDSNSIGTSMKQLFTSNALDFYYFYPRLKFINNGEK